VSPTPVFFSSNFSILPTYWAFESYATVSFYSNKSFTASSSTWSQHASCSITHFFGSFKCEMWCLWHHHPKGIIRSKRPVGAISAEMRNLSPFPISKVMGQVYLWPPDELESTLNPTILMCIIQTLYGISSRSTSFSLNRKQLAPESSKTWLLSASTLNI